MAVQFIDEGRDEVCFAQTDFTLEDQAASSSDWLLNQIWQKSKTLEKSHLRYFKASPREASYPTQKVAMKSRLFSLVSQIIQPRETEPRISDLAQDSEDWLRQRSCLGIADARCPPDWPARHDYPQKKGRNAKYKDLTPSLSSLLTPSFC